MLAAGKVRCLPSSPCSRSCAWLWAALLLPSPSLRAEAVAQPGRDGNSKCRKLFRFLTQTDISDGCSNRHQERTRAPIDGTNADGPATRVAVKPRSRAKRGAAGAGLDGGLRGRGTLGRAVGAFRIRTSQRLVWHPRTCNNAQTHPQFLLKSRNSFGEMTRKLSDSSSQ